MIRERFYHHPPKNVTSDIPPSWILRRMNNNLKFDRIVEHEHCHIDLKYDLYKFFKTNIT